MGAVVFILTLTLLPVQTTSAQDEKVTVSKNDVGAALWQTPNGACAFLSRAVEQSAVDEFVLGDLYPKYPSNKASRIMDDLRLKYRKAIGYSKSVGLREIQDSDKYTHAVFDVASTIPELMPSLKNGWLELGDPPVLSSPDTPISSTPEGDKAIAWSVRKYWLDRAVQQRRATIKKAVFEKAQQDGQFADAYDQVNAQELGVSTKDFDVNAFLTAHPDLPILDALRKGIRRDGTLVVSLKDLEDMSQAKFGKINDSRG